jgi:hypothetical protein
MERHFNIVIWGIFQGVGFREGIKKKATEFVKIFARDNILNGELEHDVNQPTLTLRSVHNSESKLKSAINILKLQKILYKISVILNVYDENSRFPSTFFFMCQVHERKKMLSKEKNNLETNVMFMIIKMYLNSH